MPVKDEIEASKWSPKFRHGFSLWVLKQAVAGSAIHRYVVRGKEDAPSFEYYSDGSIFWRQRKTTISELVKEGHLVLSEKTIRADKTREEIFAITDEGRDFLETSKHRPCRPSETFDSEEAIVTVLHDACQQRIDARIAAAKRNEEVQRNWQARLEARKHPVQVPLEIELVPKPLHGKSFRAAIGKNKWQIIQSYIFAQANHYCRYCGVQEFRLHCHEVWDYDNENHVQKLSRCEAVCEDCHHVKHIGHTRILCDAGKLDLNKIIDHYCRVNECDRSTFHANEGHAWHLYHERSEYLDWTSDWQAGEQLLKEAEELQGDQDLPPSQSAGYWVRVYREQGEYPKHKQRGGKWLIYSPRELHDARWAIIKVATIEGKLGGSSKAATEPHPQSRTGDYVICVYTYDGEDYEDVMRVREVLHDLGIHQTLYWKPDEATRAGIYTNRGHSNVSRYRA